MYFSDLSDLLDPLLHSCAIAFFSLLFQSFYLRVHCLLSLKATLSASHFKTNYPLPRPQNAKSTRIFISE